MIFGDIVEEFRSYERVVADAEQLESRDFHSLIKIISAL